MYRKWCQSDIREKGGKTARRRALGISHFVCVCYGTSRYGLQNIPIHSCIPTAEANHQGRGSSYTCMLRSPLGNTENYKSTVCRIWLPELPRVAGGGLTKWRMGLELYPNTSLMTCSHTPSLPSWRKHCNAASQEPMMAN